MMTGQLWAIIDEDGYRLIWTASAEEHPRRAGHADECRGRKVVPLDREPANLLGEYVSAEGEIAFDVGRVVDGWATAIKAEAGRRIEAFAPLWRQLNDLANPSDPGAIERRRRIDAVRAWSNDLEAQLRAAQCAEDVAAVLVELQKRKELTNDQH